MYRTVISVSLEQWTCTSYWNEQKNEPKGKWDKLLRSIYNFLLIYFLLPPLASRYESSQGRFNNESIGAFLEKHKKWVGVSDDQALWIRISDNFQLFINFQFLLSWPQTEESKSQTWHGSKERKGWESTWMSGGEKETRQREERERWVRLSKIFR